MLNRFKETMTIDKLAPADIKSGDFFLLFDTIFLTIIKCIEW